MTFLRVLVRRSVCLKSQSVAFKLAFLPKMFITFKFKVGSPLENIFKHVCLEREARAFADWGFFKSCIVEECSAV